MQIKVPRIINGYKGPPPQRRYQMLRAIRHLKRAAHTANLKTENGLFRYQDTVPIPNTYIIADSDVFCDTPNLQPDWISPCADEPNLLKRLTHIPSTIFASLVDSINVLYNYKSILSLTGEVAFFNSRYNRLDPSTSLHKSILVQASHLNVQTFNYDSCQDGCTDSTQEVYISSSGDELLIVIDTRASNSITPCPAELNGINKAFKPSIFKTSEWHNSCVQKRKSPLKH